jgi:hypothetical protein
MVVVLVGQGRRKGKDNFVQDLFKDYNACVHLNFCI